MRYRVPPPAVAAQVDWGCVWIGQPSLPSQTIVRMRNLHTREEAEHDYQ